MKVGMVSLGCPKNQVDAEVMLGLLKAAGHTVTSAEGDADAIIVNTCGFIKDAAEESIEAVLELADLKDHGRLKYLIATGCLAQRYQDGLMNEMPEVDAFLGTGEFHKIAETLEALSTGKGAGGHTAPEPQYIYGHETPRMRFTPSHWSYLKIAEGCDNRCSYCIIPSMRGDLRSRSQKSIVEEARAMASEGVKEIVLIAQDITAYGCDNKRGATLTTLLGKLEAIKGIDWIRLMYTHPAHYTNEFIDYLADSEKVVKYLDIPIQHIDDDILKRMRRKTTAKKITALIEKLRKKVPGVSLRTSLLVGFPGETKEAFAGLLKFVKEAEFDHLGVFTYSDEEDAASYKFEKKVSEALMAERRDLIMKAQAKISLKKNKARVGKSFKVLVDGPSEESELLLAGHAYFQAPEIDGVVYITDGEAVSGKFAEVEIIEAHEYDLVGRAV